MTVGLRITVPEDDESFRSYAALAETSFGVRIPDIDHLRSHAVTRLVMRGQQVLAGAMGVLVPQFFGGRSVPSACCAAVCVAPEARGQGIAGMLIEEMADALREEGAVTVSLWTPSVGVYRRWGWESVGLPHQWTVPVEHLKGLSGTSAVRSGITDKVRAFQQITAAGWNGPVQRPSWWWDWKQLTDRGDSYHTVDASGVVTGYLTVTTVPVQPWGHDMHVRELAATDPAAMNSLLGFLGAHSSQAHQVHFLHSVMPVLPSLLGAVDQFSLQSTSWYPWMLRILDPARAVRARGWNETAADEIVIAVTENKKDAGRCYRLRVEDGQGELEPTNARAEVEVSRGNLAAWYAGAFDSVNALRMAGVQGETSILRRLIRVVGDQRPFLPDIF